MIAPKVREEAPSLTKPPLLRTPLKVAADRVVTVKAPAVRSTVPVKVNAPVLTRSPKVRSPPRVTLLAKVRARSPSLAIVGSRMQMTPVPKAALLPA